MEPSNKIAHKSIIRSQNEFSRTYSYKKILESNFNNLLTFLYNFILFFINFILFFINFIEFLYNSL